MKHLLNKIAGALAMGLGWFVAATAVALLIEALVDPNGEIVDVWIAALGYPALFSGIAFFVLIRTFERQRKFVEVPLARAATWGAVSGLMPAVVFGLLALASLPSSEEEIAFAWRLVLVLAACAPPVMAVAGCVSIAFLRTAASNIEERERLDAAHDRAAK